MDGYKTTIIAEGQTIATTKTILESFESQVPFYKVVCIGNFGVGKTAFIKRCMSNIYSDQTKTTIGVDFALKNIIIDKTKYSLQLWDISGVEIFCKTLRVYFKETMSALFFCSVTSINSLKQTDKWLTELNAKTENPNITKYLIITKLDVIHDYLDKYLTHYKLLTSHIQESNNTISQFNKLLEQKKHLFTKIFWVSSKYPKLNAVSMNEILVQFTKDITNQ